jgi:glyoxylase-like metal-dependent hydrolase (beta-lactamase superfamily II)
MKLALMLLLASEMFELVTLAPGVHAALVKPRPPTYVFANALIVVGSKAALVVDTHQSPSAAAELVGEVRRLTDVPVRYVVNTHWHGDHVYGNETYRESFPGVSFLGHHTTRYDVLGPGRKYREEELVELPQSIRDREERLLADELTDDERARIQYSLSARTRYLGELQSLEIVPPDVTFSSKLAVDLGDRIVELHHLGPAHTRGDVVVYLPGERILAAGDLLEDAFPYFGDASPSGWADALDAIAGFETEVILPSHGPVLRDRELLEVERGLLRSLVTEVQRAIAEGKSLEETKKDVTLDGFRDFFGGGEAYRAGVEAAVERAYRVP